MLTLKHLARTFDLDPYALRMALRAAGMSPQLNRRWKWPDDQDTNYKEAVQVARSLSSRSKSSSASTSSSRGSPQSRPSAGTGGSIKKH